MFSHINKIVKKSEHNGFKIPELMRYIKGKIRIQNKKGNVDKWLIEIYEKFYEKVSTKNYSYKNNR